jgi:hypothetical protein
MDVHVEAWEHVENHIFGTVCEIARRVPWGFYMDMNDIHNVSVEEFLSSEDKFDTILLHILSGEGEPKSNILDVIHSAYNRCIKLIILEHNPESNDFTNLEPVDFIRDALNDLNEMIIEENWGRNMLFACTTMSPLHLPQLNDEYYNKYINSTFQKQNIEYGTDKKHLIFTHSSESPIEFDLPKGTIYWVIGGGLCFESMKENNENILIDSVLRQVLYFTEPSWKRNRLYVFRDIEIKEDKDQWRIIKSNGVRPDSIQHLPLQKLKCENSTVYVSTCPHKFWKHLREKNNIIDSWWLGDGKYLRDIPNLYLKGAKQGESATEKGRIDDSI